MATTAVAGHDRQTFLEDLGPRTAAPHGGAAARQPAERAGAPRAGAGRRLPLIAARVPDVQFVVARAPAPGRRLVHAAAPRGAASAAGRSSPCATRPTPCWLGSDVAITASGTATVQCAIHRRPMVVIYKLSGLSHALLRPFVRVDAAAMPNLVAGARIVPGTDPGRLHAGPGGRRSRGAADRRRRSRAHAGRAWRRARQAEPAGRERARGCRRGDRRRRGSVRACARVSGV